MKIKSIKDLHAEKKRIKERQAYLELTMHSNWDELKQGLRPLNIAKDMISSILKSKTAENLGSDELLKDTARYACSLLTKKLVDIAGDKLDKIFTKDAG